MYLMEIAPFLALLNAYPHTDLDLEAARRRSALRAERIELELKMDAV